MLSAGTIVLLLNVPVLFAATVILSTFISTNLPVSSYKETIALISTILGIVVAYILYGRTKGYDIVEKKLPFLYEALNKHGWFDDIYNWYVAKVQQRIATFLATFVDLLLVELLIVRGLGIVSSVLGYGFKRMHDVSANSQVKWLVGGVIVLLILIFA